jgi:hypothetical protein
MTRQVTGTAGRIRPERPGLGEVVPRSGASATAGAERETLPFLAKLVLVSLLIPAQFMVGSLALTPSKILFLIITPVLIVKLLRGAYGRLRAPDFLIFAYSAWMTLAMLANHTPRVAIEYTGSSTIIMLGGYLTARATIRSKAVFLAVIRFLAAAVLLTLPFAIYEVITSRPIIPLWLAQIPGIASHADINHAPRLGLWRAQVVFPHPIHYGIFSLLPFSLVLVGLADSLRRLWRGLATFLIGLCCFLSLSSGPLLALMVQIGLIGWAGALRRVPGRWIIFWSLAIIGYIVAEIASGRSAIYAIVSRLSFSANTAFSRRILFNYGVEQIGRAPVLGVGYNPWPLPAWMTGSVDNFWLFVAVRFGLPAFLLLAGAFLVPMIGAGRRDFSADNTLNALRKAWIFTLVSVILALATVAVWGQIYSLVFFMLGSGIWMMSAKTSQATAAEAPTPVGQTHTTRYTRFTHKSVPATRHMKAVR